MHIIGEILTSNMKATKVSQNEYRLGLWVRDSASGVGTMSFYEPNSKRFAALGHGISDSDTGDLLNIESGAIITSKLVNITKGRKGVPGEIKGSISNGEEVGEVEKNTNFGIFGEMEIGSVLPKDEYKDGLEIAVRDEIKTGEATLVCSLENGKVDEYKILITRNRPKQ